jgi:galactokinase
MASSPSSSPAGSADAFDRYLEELYPGNVPAARERYAALEKHFSAAHGLKPVCFASAPGRVEVGGNHTDHNHGCVLAAAINLDAIAAAAPADDGQITITSEGYARPVVVRCDDTAVKKEELGTTAALVRGIIARFREKGYRSGGFKAHITSQVAPGSGLSSSAAIEVLIGTVLNALYNDGKIRQEELAVIGQYAENVYFGKPCGLMDQTASAVGGIVTIDFRDPVRPDIHRLSRSFDEFGLRVLVIHTGGSHADLTPEYASVPAEMRAVAQAMGGKVCRDIAGEQALLAAVPSLRAALGDRAILRAIHFLRETARVQEQVRALESGDIRGFLQEVIASGRSSALWLQNCYAVSMPAEQGIMLALAVTEQYPGMAQRGAWRVHGGGFAGTMLAVLPADIVPGYRAAMETLFGQGSVAVLTVRHPGAVSFTRANEA